MDISQHILCGGSVKVGGGGIATSSVVILGGPWHLYKADGNGGVAVVGGDSMVPLSCLMCPVAAAGTCEVRHRPSSLSGTTVGIGAEGRWRWQHPQPALVTDGVWASFLHTEEATLTGLGWWWPGWVQWECSDVEIVRLSCMQATAMTAPTTSPPQLPPPLTVQRPNLGTTKPPQPSPPCLNTACKTPQLLQDPATATTDLSPHPNAVLKTLPPSTCHTTPTWHTRFHPPNKPCKTPIPSQ
ncbi:hypothetical protein H4582DRAFT_2065224 [Lactarius indigo]|nr:hypothetical protein H4582DRAFT_2065224 [Lactarius indigo]